MTEGRSEREAAKGFVSRAPVPSGREPTGAEPSDETHVATEPSDTGQPDERSVGGPPGEEKRGTITARDEQRADEAFRDETGTSRAGRKPPPRH